MVVGVIRRICRDSELPCSRSAIRIPESLVSIARNGAVGMTEGIQRFGVLRFRTVAWIVGMWAIFLPPLTKDAGDLRAADELLTDVRIQTTDGERQIAGRVVAEGAAGELLVEDSIGRMRQLVKSELLSREDRRGEWAPADSAELARQLTAEAGAEFGVHETEHYLVCSNCGTGYHQFIGKLLETVYSQYFSFWEKLQVSVKAPERRLPVLLFQSDSEFQAFAARIHPETDFAGVPGFYSVRDNLVLVVDLTRDRTLRDVASVRKKLADQPLQVATIVHEAVHQLAFNSGLQQRFADFPVWYSEGLALHFEPPTERAPVLWSRPGQVSARHQPEFMRLVRDQTLSVPLSDLLVNDGAFQSTDTAVAAYAESWALVSYLIRQKPEQFASYAARLQQLAPLQSVSAAERQQMFVEAVGEQPSEVVERLIPWVRRLRVPR